MPEFFTGSTRQDDIDIQARSSPVVFRDVPVEEAPNIVPPVPDDQIEAVYPPQLQPETPLTLVDKSILRPIDKKRLRNMALILAAVLIVLGAIIISIFMNDSETRNESSTSVASLPTEDLLSVSNGDSLTTIGQININGPLQINGSFVLRPSLIPKNAKAGQMYFDKDTKQFGFYDGENYQYLVTTSSLLSQFSPTTAGNAATPGPVIANNLQTGVSASDNLSDARLSTNVALLNRLSQAFSGTNQFNNPGNAFVGSFSGNGSNLTALNATNLTLGTADDARLSTNVALLNREGQVFTGSNTIRADSNGALVIQDAGGSDVFRVNTNDTSVTTGNLRALHPATIKPHPSQDIAPGTNFVNYSKPIVGPDGLTRFLGITIDYEADQLNLVFTRCLNPACTSTSPLETILENIDIEEIFTSWPAMAINNQGQPTIIYFDTTGIAMKRIDCTDVNCSAGSRTETTLSTAVNGVLDFVRPAIAFDAQDKLNIVSSKFDDITETSETTFKRCNDVACSSADTLNLSNRTGSNSYEVSLPGILMSNGQIHINYYDSSTFRYFNVSCDGSGCVQNGAYGTGTGSNEIDEMSMIMPPPMTIGGDGFPVLSYIQDNGDGTQTPNVVICQSADCSTGGTRGIAGTTDAAIIGLTYRDNRVHAIYFEDSGDKLYYWTFDPVTDEVTNISLGNNSEFALAYTGTDGYIRYMAIGEEEAGAYTRQITVMTADGSLVVTPGTGIGSGTERFDTAYLQGLNIVSASDEAVVIKNGLGDNILSINAQNDTVTIKNLEVTGKLNATIDVSDLTGVINRSQVDPATAYLDQSQTFTTDQVIEVNSNQALVVGTSAKQTLEIDTYNEFVKTSKLAALTPGGITLSNTLSTLYSQTIIDSVYRPANSTTYYLARGTLDDMMYVHLCFDNSNCSQFGPTIPGVPLAIAVDNATGYPSILYSDSNSNLLLLKCQDQGCNTYSSSAALNGYAYGSQTDMVLDSSGKPHILININGSENYGTGRYYVVCGDDTCTTRTTTLIDSDSSWDVMLFLGSDGYARFVYYSYSADGVVLQRCLDADCNTFSSTKVGDAQLNYGAAFGSDGYLRYAEGNSDGTITLITCQNDDCSTQTDTTILSPDNKNVDATSLTLRNDVPWIAYSKPNLEAGVDYTYNLLECNDASCNQVNQSLLAQKGEFSMPAETGSSAYPQVAFNNANTGYILSYTGQALVVVGSQIGSELARYGQIYGQELNLQTASATALTVQDKDSSNILKVDTIDKTVTLMGNNANPTLNVAGSVLFKNGADSAVAFIIQDSQSVEALSVDTTSRTLKAVNLTVSGTLTANGHFITGGVAPTTAAQPAAGTGATCSVSAGSNDTSGEVTIITGSASWATGAQCTITFSAPYSQAPRPVIAPANNTDTNLVKPYVTSSTATMTIHFLTADSASRTYKFNYFNAQ